MDMPLSAMIFDIQRFCVHDGPGIRTTVFFKGCPLRCKWCHNPESLKKDTQLMFRAHKCGGCGSCLEVCPAGAHTFDTERHELDFSKCENCGNCVNVCCYGALEFAGKCVSLEDALESLMVDAPYFEIGGGVTLSGGEPLLQPEFAIVLAKELHSRKIHVALETSGFAPMEVFLSVAEKMDLILFDYKATGEREHIELTGVSQTKILENLAALDKMGKETILRCPLIPGVNDSDEHLFGIAETKKRHASIKAVELLSYHRMGEAKRVQLGGEPSLPDVGQPVESDARRWLETLEKQGCAARIM